MGGRIVKKKRPVGRPQTRWKDVVDVGLCQYNGAIKIIVVVCTTSRVGVTPRELRVQCLVWRF